MPTVNTVPVFTSSVQLARTNVTSGNLVRSVLDLIGKYGADIWVLIGRKDNTAFGSNPPSVIVRPTYSTDTKRVPGDVYGRPTNSTTATDTTLASTATAGDTQLALTSGTGFAADQIIAIETGSSSVEFARISKVVSNTAYLDAPILATHTVGTIHVTNNAESVYVPVAGGRQIEIIVDYGNSSSGPDLDVIILVNSYDKDATS